MATTSEYFDAIVIGAGAAGLFFAAEAGKRNHRVLAIDHARKLGEKIRISGGGRCNFTNINAQPENFLSQNPKFCISALRSFTARDFLNRVENAGIAWHEKKLGQLFCDDSAQQIIDMLVNDCRKDDAQLRPNTIVENVSKDGEFFSLLTNAGAFHAPNLVIATGGKSIPRIGATGFGYQIAEKFGLDVVPPRPALVPLTFEGDIKEIASGLAGVSVDASVSVKSATSSGKPHKKNSPAFEDGFLFTHRGLSGPSILQISSYWREGDELIVDLSPSKDIFAELRNRRASRGKSSFQSALAEILPKRLVQKLCERENWAGNLADWSDAKIKVAADRLHRWEIRPSGSEGYRTAEVTLGGVATNALDSRSMQATSVPGLYFIGEVVDVTGWLGGYNFQWAWSSAYAAARSIGTT